MSKKFNFNDIKGMLSRDEMKQIRGGSGYGCDGYINICQCGEGTVFCSDSGGSGSFGLTCPGQSTACWPS